MDERLAGLLAEPGPEPPPYTYWAAQLPHSEKSEEECEDAFEVRGSAFAVSDGATDYVGSRFWARLLVRHFVETRNPPIPSCGLNDLATEWRGGMESAFSGGDWFIREKLKRGTAATFLGLFLGKRWVALAAGDTCVALVRDDDLKFSFPVCRSGDFGDAPLLVHSGGPTGPKVTKLTVLSGEYLPGDVFILATDAVAKWFVSTAEAGLSPWRAFLSQPADGWFSMFVKALRKRGSFGMEDDDATVLVVEVSP